MSRIALRIALSVSLALAAPSLFAQGKKKGPPGPPTVGCDSSVDAIVFVVNDNTNVAVFGTHLNSPQAPDLIGPFQIVEVSGWNPNALALHPNQAKLYVSDRTNNLIHVFGVGDHDSCREISLPGKTIDSLKSAPMDVALHPSGDYLYVAARGNEGGLAVFDVEAKGDLSGGTMHFDGEPVMRVEIAPSGNELYLATDSVKVACEPGKKCKNFEDTFDTLIRAELTDGRPSASTRRVLSHELADDNAETPIFESLVGDQRLRGIAASAATVYVAAFYSNTIWECVADLSSVCVAHDTSMITTIPILAPWGLALDGGLLYVASYGESAGRFVNGEGASVFTTSGFGPVEPYVEGAGRARNIVVVPVSPGYAFATDFDGTLSLIPLGVDGSLMNVADSIASAGTLTKELVVLPAP